MQEIRIDDVEIISMLIPRDASGSKVSAVTPGCVFIPAPTSDTRATSESLFTPEAPRSGTSASQTSVLTARSCPGTVKEMSVVPCSEVFCTIMSTLMLRSASARNSRAASPGRSGTPMTVTLASDSSWVTAVTTACSIDASSSSTHVDVALGQCPEQPGGQPGAIGHPDDGDLGLRLVVGHRGDDCLFHRCILLVDPGTGLPCEARPHMERHLVVTCELH